MNLCTRSLWFIWPILSGLLLAILKSLGGRDEKTTKLKLTDKLHLPSGWYSPAVLYESLTSGASDGSFLTGSLGSVLASFLPAKEAAYPFWWLYSLSLGTFFILLPITRYMHIPTELFLIFMRNSGIRTGNKQGAFTEVQTFSCSSCGLCIDACQMNFSAGIRNIQSAYLLKAIRNDDDTYDIAHNCLMCGRCDQICPVGIELSPIRMIQRRMEASGKIRNVWKGYFRIIEPQASGKQVSGQTYDFCRNQILYMPIFFILQVV